MKRFAVILIIAVLALGCVFATAGDSQKTASQNANSGNSFIVETTIGTIYPVYQLLGNNNVTNVYSAATLGNANKITGMVDGDNVYIFVYLQHFGKVDNDLEPTKAKTDIRYKGSVTVTITAGALVNTSSTNNKDANGAELTAANTVNADGHVYMSENPVVSANFVATSGTNFNSTIKSQSGNVVEVTAEYTNGQKVLTGTSAVTIANGTFKWDTSKLTAGDTYQANVKVEYTAE